MVMPGQDQQLQHLFPGKARLVVTIWSRANKIVSLGAAHFRSLGNQIVGRCPSASRNST
jgi:hypothetical protein